MIKFEFPADRTDIALAIGQALTAIGQGKAVEANLTTAARVTSAVKAADNVVALAANPAPGEAGPFYWLHHESEAYGTVETRAELEAVLDGGDLAEEVTAEQYALVTAQWIAAGREEGKPGPSTALQGADAASGASVDGAKLDEKGVAFNGDYCSKAAQPFYGSGKKKGQWKKRQGVDEGDYDDWYNDALTDVVAPQTAQAHDHAAAHSDVASQTFGKAQPPVDETAPQDAGQLMKWVSEQQAAGNITQQQVTDAYSQLQLPFDAVMNPAYPVAQNCAAIYNHLKGEI